ncbi:MAG: hypothetical protein HWN51_06190 [Desulfobacterales bacterium]|nr:hypothetical protein [Desulfobacterales bacterium]
MTTRRIACSGDKLSRVLSQRRCIKSTRWIGALLELPPFPNKSEKGVMRNLEQSDEKCAQITILGRMWKDDLCAPIEWRKLHYTPNYNQ